jgi:hypothetical protein
MLHKDKDFGKAAQGDSTIVHQRSANAVQNLYLKVYILFAYLSILPNGINTSEYALDNLNVVR